MEKLWNWNMKSGKNASAVYLSRIRVIDVDVEINTILIREDKDNTLRVVRLGFVGERIFVTQQPHGKVVVGPC